ncbi:MAG: hypothetical protein J1E02_06120 [Coprobacter sp.]|nr:hypothetical protein [Coprobacter sp.]
MKATIESPNGIKLNIDSTDISFGFSPVEAEPCGIGYKALVDRFLYNFGLNIDKLPVFVKIKNLLNALLLSNYFFVKYVV